MMFRLTRWAMLSAVLTCLSVASTRTVWSQEYRGSLQGSITDPTGALIPAAKITIKNKATNVLVSVGTTDRGSYTALNLDAGFYTVTITAPGFKTLIRDNIEVRSGEKYGLDLALQVGTRGEEVVVTTAATGIITDTGSGASVLDQTLVTNLPLSGGNVFTLTQETAGANHGGGSLSHLSERPFDNGGQEGYSINGGAAGGNHNAFLVDGSPNNNNEGLAFVPPPDAVSQVTVITNSYDAEFGKTSGGIVSVSLKQGTNQYHGSANWDFRNNHADAQLYQNFGQKPQVTQWSVGVFTLNGPVVIPHVYNGRNRTFISGSYEHFFDKIANQVNRTVPSISQTQGNFCSGAPGNEGIGTTIYDPLTGTPTARLPFGANTNGGCPQGQTGTNLLVAAPDRIDPMIKNVLANYITPNVVNPSTGILCTNSRVSGCNTNNTVPAGRGDHYHAVTLRVDHNLSDKERFFGSYNEGVRVEYINNPGTINAVGSPFYPAQTTSRKNHTSTLNLTSILSPTFTATSKLNWIRTNGLGRTNQPGATPESFGISPTFATLFGADNFPGFNFQGYTGFSQGGQDSTTFTDQWTLSEALNKVIGVHSLKAGGGLTTLLSNNRTASQVPSIGYSVGYTQQNYLKADVNSGDGIASALLGYTSGISYTNPLSLSQKNTYNFVFVQDDWRVSKRLTVNLGLRWDNQTPPHERYNRSVVGFNTGAPSIVAGGNAVPIQGLTPAQQVALSAQILNGGGGGYIGGLVYADPANRSPYKPFYRDFQPRFGFAYAVNSKLVIRGGWGRTYDNAGAFTFAPTTGFTQTTTVASSSDGSGASPVLCRDIPGCAVPANNPLAGLSANGYASALPHGLIAPSGSSLGAKTGAGSSISILNPDFRPSHFNQFNVGFEYQLPLRMVAHVEYNGSRGFGLPVNKSINQLTATQFLALGATANTTVPNPFYDTATATALLPGTTLSTPNTTVGQLLKPFPQYTNVVQNANPIGRLWYNSLQAKLDKRLSYGLDAFANFTWGKNLGATSYLNPSYDSMTNLTRQLVGIDVPFSTNIGMVWALPFFNSPEHKFVRAALGGWSISGNAAFHSGILIASPGGTSGVKWTGVNPGKVVTGTFAGRTFANAYNACVINAAGTALLANSACPATATIANAAWKQQPDPFYLNNIPPYFGSNRFAAPPYASATIFKAFQVTERVKMEARLLAENLTNTPYFTSIASTTPTTLNYTQINKTQSNDPRSLQATIRISF